MPRHKLCHVGEDLPPGVDWSTVPEPGFCGADGFVITQTQYLGGYMLPNHVKDFCALCEDVVRRKHPMPDFIELQRSTL